ncbi:DinB family protein [Amycolatopsis jiangsuensis]|uniref:Mini-circle protein n=1 Tax=Amycolatopsis jiangsuensis TaxID=1181879 RepID=A0A840IZB8_9PSEU|nr:DinB family protein [Amycolatopsis jiangsuensis]MBB4686859.1 hypothetical protein [Amycolatopsis jiangsuensis]
MDRIPRHLSPTAAGERAAIPRLADERETLLSTLDWHRQTFGLKCAGLEQKELSARAVPASTVSLHGLARHLAGVERWWFRIQFGGADLPLLYYTDDDPDQDFDSLDGDAEEALAVWRAECAHARAIAVAAESLEARGTSKITGEPFTLRWLLLDMTTEYARHLGHADLLREAIDGSVGR